MVFLFVIIASFVFVFFFQAEDGIRDVAVTGVQTCALPISFGCRKRLLTTRAPCQLMSIVGVISNPAFSGFQRRTSIRFGMRVSARPSEGGSAKNFLDRFKIFRNVCAPPLVGCIIVHL